MEPENNIQPSSLGEVKRPRRKIFIRIAIALLLILGVGAGIFFRKNILVFASRMGVLQALREAGIIKPSTEDYFRALSSQNLFYDYNRDGVVSGDDYSLLLKSKDKPKPPPIPPLPAGEPPTGEDSAAADNLALPSLRGFGSDLFTGSTTISYPIEVPAYKANLGLSLAVSYSSSAVDDLYSGTETKWRNDPNHPYQKQAGLFGLGWGMSAGGSIVRDTSGTLEDEADDKFILSFSGGAANLTKETDDGSYSVWRTVPNQKLKVERWSLCKDFVYEEDEILPVCRYRWTVTDGAGTKYYFGYPATVADWKRDEDPDKDNFSEGEGNDWFPLYDETADGPQGYTSWMIYGSNKKGHHALTYNWHLYQAESIYDQSGPPQQPPDCNGCEAEINYRYLFELRNYQGRSYVAAEYPYKISYGRHEVSFGKENRLDWQTHAGDQTADEQIFFSQKLINKIIIKTLDKVRKVYKFEYSYGWDPTKHNDINQNGVPEPGEIVAGQVIHLLLNKVIAYSDDPDTNPSAKRLPAYTFSYGEDCGVFKGGCPLTAFVSSTSDEQAQTANDFFLRSADNGLNGKVSFEYWDDGAGNNALAVKYCDKDKLTQDQDICKTDHAYNTQRHRIKATISHDGMANSVRTEFNYTGAGATQGLAFVTGYGDKWLQGQNCCSVNQCDSGNPPEGCRCPGDQDTALTEHEWDCTIYSPPPPHSPDQCDWKEESGLGCPSDLPIEYAAECIKPPSSDNWLICPGTQSQPNLTCVSNCKPQLDQFSGFEFLGYPQVETIVYEKNSTTEIAAKSKSYYHQTMETASCFKPSPLKGAVSDSFVYDADNPSLYNAGHTSYKVRFGDMFGSYVEKNDTDLNSYCGDYDPETSVSMVLNTENVSASYDSSPEKLCTKSTVDYNNLDGSIDHYALPHKQIAWGKVDCTNPADDDTSDIAKYSFTEYTGPNEAKGLQPLPKESWVSGANSTPKYKHAYTYYDGQDLGVLGEFGRVSGTLTMLEGAPYASTAFSYNSSYPWQLESQTDPLGRTTSFEYDNIFRSFVTRQVNPLGQDVYTDYDFNIVDPTHPNYQGVLGVPVRTVDINDEGTYFVYDSFGRMIESYLPGKKPGTGAKPNAIASYYYFNDEDISPCNWSNNCFPDLGKQINGQYGPKMLTSQGVLVDESGSIGKISGSHVFYNGAGQEVQTRGVWYDGEWANGGIPVEGEGLRDILTSKSYTSLGQVEFGTLSYTAAPYTDFSVSSFDNRYFLGEPQFPQVQFTFDGFGRPKMTYYPDGTSDEILYEVDGNPLKTKARNKNCTDSSPETLCAESIVTKNAFGQTLLTSQVAGDATYNTSFEYHPVLGAPTVTKDTLGNPVNIIEYDALGRKQKMWDIDMSPAMSGDSNSWRYTYDLLGNLTGQINPKGINTTMEYDSLNRMTKKFVGTKKELVNTYDACEKGRGRICKVESFQTPGENLIESVEYKYNNRGQAFEVKQMFNNLPDPQVNNLILASEFSFEEGGRIKTEKHLENAVIGYPEETLVYTYDRPYLLALSGTDVYGQNARYNKDGQILSYTSGNGVVTSYAYDANNLRLNNLQIIGPNFTETQKLMLGYEYDHLGNILAIDDQNSAHNPNDPLEEFYMSQTFTYDALNRVRNASGAYVASFSYDDIGNILTKAEGPETVALSYGNYDSGFYHRPQTATIAGTSYSYIFDPIGNMTNDGRKTLEHDSSDRITQIALNNGTATSFIYNASGSRIMKKVNGQDSVYYLSPSLEVTVLPDGGISWRKNYFFGGKLVAVRESVQAPTSSPSPTPQPSPSPSAAPSPASSPSPSPTPTPTPIPLHKAFVTANAYPGNLGGLAGADSICQEDAAAAGLSGRYVAWLSTDSINAKDRVSDWQYVLADKTNPAINKDKADLLDGSLSSMLNLEASGKFYAGPVWTGTKANGIKNTRNCNNWTSSTTKGTSGGTEFSSAEWTEKDSSACQTSLRFYCFESIEIE